MAVIHWHNEKIQSGVDYVVNPLANCWYGIAHHINVWRSAWKHQNEQPDINLAKGDELEFLPAVFRGTGNTCITSRTQHSVGYRDLVCFSRYLGSIW